MGLKYGTFYTFFCLEIIILVWVQKTLILKHGTQVKTKFLVIMIVILVLKCDAFGHIVGWYLSFSMLT